MELTRTQKISYSAVAALGVVFVGVLTYLQVLKATGGIQQSVQRSSVVEGLRSEVASQPFDAEILSDPRYQDLDRSLFDQGRLPVPAPAVLGRPNLF